LIAALLEVRGLVKRYPRPGIWNRTASVAAVAGVDLTVMPGEVIGLIGESGSGKTTLIRAALGLLPFQEGTVLLLGQDLQGLSGSALREMRRQVQLLFQHPRSMLNPGLTVRQHLVESARLHRPEESEQAVVAAVAQQVGLSHRLDARPSALSGGEQRRVGLARVLVAQPRLLVADEPTSGLDAALKADLIDLLLAARGPDRAIVLVSHDLPLVSYACGRIVVMLAGRIVERFETSALVRRDHHPYTESLLQAAGMRKGHSDTELAGPQGRPDQGCAFAGACAVALAKCRTERPGLRNRPGGHAIACHVIGTEEAA
jgi:oligopeptide/dipeptide ABC transporter ATP-binding protein